MTRTMTCLCPDCGLEYGPLLVLSISPPIDRLCRPCRERADRISAAFLALSRVALWMWMELRYQKWQAELPGVDVLVRCELLGATIYGGSLAVTFPEGS